MTFKLIARARLVLATSALLAAFAGSAQAEPGITTEAIHLGMSSPFSGPNGDYGIAMRTGVLAAFDEVNASGGIGGRKLTLTALDDGYETERAVANTRALIDTHQVFALLAFYGSSPTTAAMNVFSHAGVPLVGTISGADALRTPVNRHMFNLRASYADETTAIVKHLVALGITRIAVFYQDDGFGQSGLAGVTTQLKAQKLAPVATGTVPRNSVEVGPAVAKIAKAAPQAVIMVTLVKPTAAFVSAMRAAGQTPQFVTLSPVGANLLIKEMGESGAHGLGISQVMPYPWNDGLPLIRRYRQALAARDKHTEPDYYSLEGYVAARVMIEALKRIGGPPTREKLITALEQAPFDLGGYRLAFTPNDHGGAHYVDLTIIGRNGRILR
ncbi:ABC transporter substrate-binding protein [Denitromonas sp.]|uniref:ABC transporter substrate-binding protein n=1 Tax=Denitromonas sp. TaxID=2734609 RepID=UPI003A86032C